MKKCSKCGQEKTLLAFTKHCSKKDGLHNQCKNCRKIYSQSTQAEITKRRQTLTGKEAHCREARAYRSRHPEKTKAHRAVSRAVKTGEIHRPSICEGCFQEKFVHGHHSDYDKHLDVDWLCTECHTELHNELRRGSVLSAG